MMTIPLKVLIEARECFAMVREADACCNPLNPTEYARVLVALDNFSRSVDVVIGVQVAGVTA